MKLRTAILTVSAFALAAACTPAAQEPAPAAPVVEPIAEPAPESGPAAENTTDSLSSTPAADPAAPAPAAPATPAPAAAGPTAVELANGRATYASTCAMCHGPTGQGTQMGIALHAGLDYAAIKEKVTKGMVKPGDTMPPMGAALAPDALDTLVKFVEAGLPQ